ncbi:MAG: DEAD/DEAH box helicase [Candidatus Hodarchaeales archaeon]|jgi:superfamily II DNA/RNA helicase
MNFNEFNLSPNILKAVSRLGFEQPTLIQELSIPEALSGNDIVGQSQTGTGKTAAFGLPIIQNIKPGKGPQALIITPTRELCIQVAEAMQEYCFYSKIKSKTVYGGVGYGPQIKALKNSEIIVATPGRLLDHIYKGNTNFSNIKYLVLDEADKMFEMGFLQDIEKIISYVPKNRITSLFSATFPIEVEDLLDKHLNDPIFFETEPYVSEEYLKQHYYWTENESKLSILLHLLNQAKKYLTAIVFCATRKETDFLYKNLKNNSIKASPIHGGHSQTNRQKSINLLHDGKIQVLVATDIAARGLDIRNVNHIINWDIPPNHHEYVHRIGRTARAGDIGYAISLVSIKDFDSFKRIMEHQDQEIELKELPQIKKVKMIRGGNGRPYGNRKSDNRQNGNRRTNRTSFQKSNKFQRKPYNQKRGNRSQRSDKPKRADNRFNERW